MFPKYHSICLCFSDIDSFSNMVTACKSEHFKGFQTDDPDIFDFILFSFRSSTNVAEVDEYLHARTSQPQVSKTVNSSKNSQDRFS